ncbi:MAG: uroporphyrinogen decarboxylase family protein [Atribacterota bacterium]|nr:uroporphyrinogen decarboxylase family protein [Atribacterota bacterium]
MNHVKRIETLLSGGTLKKPAINLWKHFPPYDENPQNLIKKIIQFQERFNWDFVKITYHGLHFSQDWGTQVKWPERDCQWPDTCSKVGIITDYPIKTAQDWTKINVLPIKQNSIGGSLEVVKEVVNRFKGEVPVVITVFNSLLHAMKMSNDKMLIHMRTNPEYLKRGLEVITETSVSYVKELIKFGIDGVFFATQLANYDKMSVEEYEKFGKPYDLEIINAFKNNTWFNILHMHGNAPMFDILEKYPVQALNWHDRLVDISLKEGRKKTDKLLIGGVDEYKILNEANEEELLEHFNNAFDQVEDKRLILGPGCCVPLYVNENRFDLANKVVERMTS